MNNIKIYELIKAVVFDLGDTLVSQATGDSFPFAVEVLDWLKGRYKLALITNVMSTTPREKINSILRDAGLEGFFDVIVVSSEYGFSKPDPRIFEIAFNELGVRAEEAVMIGNTISTDIFGANRVGMKTILFQPQEAYQRSEWETPDHEIRSLRELINILKK